MVDAVNLHADCADDYGKNNRDTREDIAGFADCKQARYRKQQAVSVRPTVTHIVDCAARVVLRIYAELRGFIADICVIGAARVFNRYGRTVGVYEFDI